MELLENYTNALDALLKHIGFTHGHEFVFVDNDDFYWHLASGKVLYSKDKNVDEDPFTSRLVTKKIYERRVFSGNKLTGILTGEIFGDEILMIFDNSKYTGNAKAEKIYL